MPEVSGKNVRMIRANRVGNLPDRLTEAGLISSRADPSFANSANPRRNHRTLFFARRLAAATTHSPGKNWLACAEPPLLM